MTSIIEAFAAGDIRPGERTFQSDAAFDKAFCKMERTEEKLLSMMDEPQRVVFAAFLTAQSSVQELLLRREYAQGYALGALMMQEVMEIKGTWLEEG